MLNFWNSEAVADQFFFLGLFDLHNVCTLDGFSSLCLVAYLHDGVDAWDLQPDGTYKRVNTDPVLPGHSAQAALVARYSSPKLRRK